MSRKFFWEWCHVKLKKCWCQDNYDAEHRSHDREIRLDLISFFFKFISSCHTLGRHRFLDRVAHSAAEPVIDCCSSSNSGSSMAVVVVTSTTSFWLGQQLLFKASKEVVEVLLAIAVLVQLEVECRLEKKDKY